MIKTGTIAGIVLGFLILLSISCKKEKKNPQEKPADPVPQVEGFRLEDQNGHYFSSDSAIVDPDANLYQIISYRGTLGTDAHTDVRLTIVKPPLRTKTYEIDSVDTENTLFTFDNSLLFLKPTAGSLIITKLEGGKMSGSFSFSVEPVVYPSTTTVTVLKGYFGEIPVR